MFRSATAVKLCLPLALLVSAAPALGQARDTTRIPSTVAYEMGKKSPWAAAGLEYLFPMAGFAYAKSAKRGLPPAALFLTGFGIAVVGVDKYSDDLIGAGVLTMLGSRIWGIISAGSAASAYNRRLSERLQVTPQASGKVGIELTLPVMR